MEENSKDNAETVNYITVQEDKTLDDSYKNIDWGYTLDVCAIMGGIILGAIILNFVLRHTILAAFKKFSSHRKSNTFVSIIVHEKLISRMIAVIPPVLAFSAIPFVLSGETHEFARMIAMRIFGIYLIVVCVRLINAVIGTAHEIFYMRAPAGHKPLKGFVQVAQLVIICIGAIACISVLIGENPMVLIAGLGAASAVLMLVFKDPIMSFAAGIQLSANDMLRLGDWITMPNYNADGDVIEVNINSVKVRNFDNTVTTVPTYALVTGAFQNWRAMSESGGRRVKRHICIDMESVKFCDDAMLEKYSKVAIIKDYVAQKQQELAEYNKGHGIDETVKVNGRRQTNLGVFRAYINEYLKEHPMVNHNMTCFVRQLQPTERGIPLELYFFTSDVRWIPYENIQSDVFDHLIATVEEFDLTIFQSMSGADIRSLSAPFAPKNT